MKAGLSETGHNGDHANPEACLGVRQGSQGESGSGGIADIRIVFVSPYPPAKDGIGDYSQAIITRHNKARDMSRYSRELA
jgi:hypothetical protein